MWLFVLDRNSILSQSLSSCLHVVLNVGMTLSPGQMPPGDFRPCIHSPSVTPVAYRTSSVHDSLPRAVLVTPEQIPGHTEFVSASPPDGIK